MNRIVVIGASAGGIDSLKRVVSMLSPAFPAPICVVVHLQRNSIGMVPHILNGSGPLRAVNAETGMQPEAGGIYVAPPNRHLIVEPSALRIALGPTENRWRPSIDVLFRSAATAYGPNAIGVVLSGFLDDGSSGLWAIKQRGGVAIAQDPDDALFPDMPRNAIQHVAVDHIVSSSGLADLLIRLTSAPALEVRAMEEVPKEMRIEVDIAKNDQNAQKLGIQSLGVPSSFACPDCHGVLLQLKEAGRLRFRCHVGHAYSVKSLISAMCEAMDQALWTALRAFDEGSIFLQQMSQHTRERHESADTELLTKQETEARRVADSLRQLIASRADSTK